MNAMEQITLSLTLITRLRHVLVRETTALREMHIQPLADLQAEKAELVAAYEVEICKLRASPELLGQLEHGVRETLAAATRELQAAITANVRTLEAARVTLEGVVRMIGQSIAATGGRPAYASPTADGSQPAARVLPVAVNRHI